MNSAVGQLTLENCGIGECLRHYESAAPLSISKPVANDFQVEAMLIRFPVVQKLMGRGNFMRLIDSYLASKECDFLNIDTVGFDFADFVQTHASADTPQLILQVARFEWLLYSLPKPLSSFKGVSYYLSQIFKTPKNFQLGLSENVALFESMHGEVEVWFANQRDFQLEPDCSYPIGQYWLIERTTSGLSVTPISQYHYHFYSRLENECTVSSLNQDYSYQTINKLLANLMNNNIVQVVS